MCVTIWISIYVSACPSFYTSISLYLARNLSICRSVYSSWNVEILPAGATQTKQTPNIHQYRSVFRSVPIPIVSLHQNFSPLPHWHPKKSDVSTWPACPQKKGPKVPTFPRSDPLRADLIRRNSSWFGAPALWVVLFWWTFNPSFHDGTKERISAGGFEDFWSTKRGDGEPWWSRSWSWLKYR